MKFVIVFALVAFLGLSHAQMQSRLVSLPVDHFNPLDRRTFDARYFVNAEHWLAGGVIFLYVSGGFEVYDDFLGRGAMFELARDTNGHLFSLEHRYFGTSQPTEDTSVPNLQWLTIDQTLADIAHFISFIRANYYGAQNSRVILWGRGYGGALAIWARQKYPNAVDAVWASSAPINAVLQYNQFLPNTFYTLRSIGGPDCGEVLTEAFRMIETAIRARDTSHVEERLRLCSPIDIDIEEDLARVFYGLAADIGYTFVSNSRYPDIDEKCSIMTGMNNPENPPENALDAFARWYVDEYNRNLDCIDLNNTSVLSLFQEVGWNTVSTIAGRRQNFWLQCTQLGQFAVANEGERHPFGWRFDINFFRRWCAEAFDMELFSQDFMEESIARTNRIYGGLEPHVYRVFFTHGEMDPQRHLGPNEDLNDSAPVVVMSLQSAGRDFGSPSETDYAVLRQTKERARQLMLQWVFEALDEETTRAATTTSESPSPDPMDV